jgi:hypothetical protein
MSSFHQGNDDFYRIPILSSIFSATTLEVRDRPREFSLPRAFPKNPRVSITVSAGLPVLVGAFPVTVDVDPFVMGDKADPVGQDRAVVVGAFSVGPYLLCSLHQNRDSFHEIPDRLFSAHSRRTLDFSAQRSQLIRFMKSLRATQVDAHSVQDITALAAPNCFTLEDLSRFTFCEAPEKNDP